MVERHGIDVIKSKATRVLGKVRNTRETHRVTSLALQLMANIRVNEAVCLN